MKTMTQAECDQANYLREYEQAHRVWMNTSIFNPEAQRQAKNALADALDKYIKAVEAANPTWIVF